MIRREVLASKLLANALEKWIHRREKRLRREASPSRIPHPFVAHGADAPPDFRWIAYSCERRCDHIAVFKRAGESLTLAGIVSQPMQYFREAPFVRVDAATPINGFEFFLACQLCDLASLFDGTVIAPEVIVIQWQHVSVYRNDTRTGCVERDGGDILAANSGVPEHLPSVPPPPPPPVRYAP